MSQLRQYNRKERRALARMTPEKARQTAAETYDKYRADMIADVYGQFMTLFLLYLHNELHYGEVRIKRAFVEFDDLVRAVRRKNRLTGIAEVRQILKDDCNFDIAPNIKNSSNPRGNTNRCTLNALIAAGDFTASQGQSFAAPAQKKQKKTRRTQKRIAPLYPVERQIKS